MKHSIGPEERQFAYSVALKIVRDSNAADDVAQDALLLAHRKKDSFRGESRFKTWLYRIVSTSALMYLRKKKRLAREISASQSADGSPGILENTAGTASDPETSSLNSELISKVHHSLDGMGDKYKNIFWMRYLQGYTESEIAKKLSISIPTVKSRAFRARNHVKASLLAA